ACFVQLRIAKVNTKTPTTFFSTWKDTQLYPPALAMVPAAFGPADIGRVTDLMAGLPEDGQIQLTAVLAGYPGRSRPALRSSPPRKARPST
ncbi:MAG: hypothetical protein MZV64_68100, partial [Ignavibacteriales bacterium]|nr:hypothetical protein [Ignavibacteriales bacterium]